MLKKPLETLFNKENLIIIDENNNKFLSNPKAKKNLNFKLIIKNKKFYRTLLVPNAFNFGEAYIKKYFEIEGDIVDFIDYFRKIKLPFLKKIGAYYQIIILNIIKNFK